MKKLNALAVLYFLATTCFVPHASSQSTDDALKRMVISEGSGASAAIMTALDGEKADVLVFAIHNPSWARKSEAVEAISKLPAAKRDHALVEILNERGLWENRIKGGRGQMMQDNFEDKFKKILANRLGSNVTQLDLFDGAIRAKLSSALQSG